MRFKHYFSQKQIPVGEKRELLALIEDCDFIYKKALDSVVESIDDKSVVCAIDEYGEICGFASILDEGNAVYIAELYVHMSARRKGYGKALIEKVMQFAKFKGYDIVTLCVGHNNKSARTIYENHKFIYSRTNTSLSTMKRYVSNKAYKIGGVLHEVVKLYGVDNLEEDVKKIANFEMFYKYFSSKDDEKIKKCIESGVFSSALKLIKELFNGRTLIANEILNGNFVKAVGTDLESCEDLKTAALGVKAFLDFRNETKVKDQIKIIEEKNKTL